MQSYWVLPHLSSRVNTDILKGAALVLLKTPGAALFTIFDLDL